ncbi:MAG: hypothetical protein R2751_18085 [Bacteroidales bacterium]
MKRFLSLPAVLLLTLTHLSGQTELTPSVVASAGGYAEGSNFSISWTLGELAVSTLTGGNLILTQGFQQPLAMSTGTGPVIAELSNISVFPNPVEEMIHIRFDLNLTSDYRIEIQDVTGRILHQNMHRNIGPGQVVQIEASS